MSATIRSDSEVFRPAATIRFARLRRTAVAIIGFTVLLIGLAMVVLPGPATLVIPLGLAILATEFVWAKRLLDQARATVARKGERKQEQSHAADDQIGDWDFYPPAGLQ